MKIVPTGNACGLMMKGSRFEPCTACSRSTADEEGNDKQPHKIPLPKKISDSCLRFLPRPKMAERGFLSSFSLPFSERVSPSEVHQPYNFL